MGRWAGTSLRPVGRITNGVSIKIMWGILLSEAKRTRILTRGVDDSRYVARIGKAGWASTGLEGWQGEGQRRLQRVRHVGSGVTSVAGTA